MINKHRPYIEGFQMRFLTRLPQHNYVLTYTSIDINVAGIAERSVHTPKPG